MKVGTLLKTKTTTKNDVFGEVLWEVVQTGLPAPEKDRKGKMDGVRCVMLGGSGVAARKGYKVIDSEYEIAKNIAARITAVVPDDQRATLVAKYDALARKRTLEVDA